MIDFFTSDCHYGHANIIKYCNRPFVSVEEMDRELIARYNAIVSYEHTVMFLGDVFICKGERAASIMKQLSGKKLLVLGNHDKSAAAMAALGFDAVMETCTLHIAGRAVRASHFPYQGTPDHGYEDGGRANKFADKQLKRNSSSKDEVLLHGHTHRLERVGKHNMIHVGVDAWDYAPVSMTVIEELITSL
jgi:calcineurin-like phosphoesterase family protein